MTDPDWIRILAGRRVVPPMKQWSLPNSNVQNLSVPHKHDESKCTSSTHNDRLCMGSQPSISQNHVVTATAQADIDPEEAQSDDNYELRGGFGHPEVANIWYNPSIDQIIESLRVVMMTKPTTEALSPDNDANILSLIENHSVIQRRLSKAKKKLIELEIRHEKDLEDLDALKERSCVREARYKAEIKRLELYTQGLPDGGKESAATATSDSLANKAEGIASQSDDESKHPLVSTLEPEQRPYGENATDYHSILDCHQVLDKDSDIKMSRLLRNRQPIDIGRYMIEREELTPHNNGSKKSARIHTVMGPGLRFSYSRSAKTKAKPHCQENDSA